MLSDCRRYHPASVGIDIEWLMTIEASLVELELDSQWSISNCILLHSSTCSALLGH